MVKRFLIAITLFALLIGFRFYLDEPYIQVVNPGIESMYSHSVNMAAVIFGETRKTMAAVVWGRVLVYHTETSHAPYYKDCYIIKDKTIDELRGKITDNEKLKALVPLKNKTFTKAELTGELKKLSFNEEEIKIILTYAFYMSEFLNNQFNTEGKQILPILRLVTWLDNHFIKAYDFGGYFLAINLNKPREGVDFLEEGIKNNPNSYNLNWGMAYIYFHKVRDYNKAIHYAKKALNIAIKSGYTITDKMIEGLRNEITDSEKLKAIESLRNKTFSEAELKRELKKLSFNDQESKVLLEYVTTQQHEYEYETESKELNCVNSLRIIGHSYRILGDKKNAETYFILIGKVGPEFEDLSKRLLRDLYNAVWLRITDNTIESMKDKLPSDKLESLKLFVGHEYSKELLTQRLENLDFTREEIEKVSTYAEK